MALAAAQKVKARQVPLRARGLVLQLELVWQPVRVLQRVQVLELVLELARVRARLLVRVLELAWVRARLLVRVLELARVRARLLVRVLELARLQARLLVWVLELARVRARLLVWVLELARLQARFLVMVLELPRVRVSKSVQPWDTEHLQLLFLDHEPESLLVMQRVRGPPWKHLQVLQEQRPLV